MNLVIASVFRNCETGAAKHIAKYNSMSFTVVVEIVSVEQPL